MHRLKVTPRSFSILLFSLFLFIRASSGLPRYVPLKALKDDLAHRLALQGRLRFDLAP